MARYDYGTNRNYGPRRGDWSNPNGNLPGVGYDRMRSGYRPGVGGYRGGYQGGSGGMNTGGMNTGGMRCGQSGGRYGRDYWWIGEHALGREGQSGRYDDRYQRFDRESHPRYSPVGGMYHAMGGQYMYDRAPRPLREDTWFSDWTRWF